MSFFFFFFNDTATTEIYTLSLHDALPIYHIRPSATRSIASPGVMGVPAQLPRAIWLHPAKPISSAIGEKARREATPRGKWLDTSPSSNSTRLRPNGSRLSCGALKKNDSFPQSTRAASFKRLLGRAA